MIDAKRFSSIVVSTMIVIVPHINWGVEWSMFSCYTHPKNNAHTPEKSNTSTCAEIKNIQMCDKQTMIKCRVEQYSLRIARYIDIIRKSCEYLSMSNCTYIFRYNSSNSMFPIWCKTKSRCSRYVNITLSWFIPY